MIGKKFGVGLTLLFTMLLASGVAAADVPRNSGASAGLEAAAPTQPIRHTPVTAKAAAKTAPVAHAKPVTLTIRTEPALANVRLVLDHVPFTTNSAGIGSVTQDHDYANHTLTLATPTLTEAGHRHVFARWVGERDPDQVYNAALTGVSMRASYVITAAFATERAVTASFVDQHGTAIPADQISQAVARSDTGAEVAIKPDVPVWLGETKVTYRNGSLSASKVTYAWQKVVVKGSNIVDAGKQTFTPATQPEVKVVGQFHDLTVAGSDAVFGSAAGTAATLTYPDGTTETSAVSGDQQVRFNHLPRGTYQVKLDAGSAIVANHNVRLSKNVTVSVPVISVADIALVVGAALLVMLGVVLAGRRHLVTRWIAPLKTRRLARSG